MESTNNTKDDDKTKNTRICQALNFPVFKIF